MHYTVKGTDTLEHLCPSRIKIISRCIIWTKHDYSFIGWLKEKYSLLFMYSNEHGCHYGVAKNHCINRRGRKTLGVFRVMKIKAVPKASILFKSIKQNCFYDNCV